MANDPYVERVYRQVFGAELQYFAVKVKQSDLMVGARVDCRAAARAYILEARTQIEAAITFQSEFLTALTPVYYRGKADTVPEWMLNAANIANVGPMAAVAGAVAQYTGRALYDDVGGDILVENGGDIYLRTEKPRRAAIFAGGSPLSMRLCVEIPPGEWGLCASSGKIGPSLSFGHADAAVVLCRDAALADAAATALGNLLKSREDISRALEKVCAMPGIQGALAIVDDQFGAAGNIRIAPWQRDVK